MKTTEPLVSVIMPVYNAEKYIATAVASILNQTYTNLELILIDDASSDNSIKIVEAFPDNRIKLLRNSGNKGIAFSTNKGIKFANGKYIALLDDDDIAYPNRIAKSVKFLEKNNDFDMVGGNYKIIDNGEIIESNYQCLHNPRYIRANLLFSCVLRNGSSMYRSEFIEKEGIFYEDGCYGMQDFKFWTDFSAKGGKMTVVDDLFYIQRKHSRRETMRIMTDYAEQRKRKYREIQSNSLKMNGFKLSNEKEFCLTDVLCEQSRPIKSATELRLFHQALKDLVGQAESLKLDFKEEIAILCRKLLFWKMSENENMIWRL